MTDPIDEQTDPQIDAVVELLSGSLRAVFGEAIVATTQTWPAVLPFEETTEMPVLVVCRETDVQEDSPVEESLETATIRIDYYAPVTDPGTLAARWPVLRKIWKHCIARLRVGYDPAVAEGARLLADVGFDAPSPVVGEVRYAFAPPIEGGLVPSFQASVTMRVSDALELEFLDPLDDLEEIATSADVDDEPGFSGLEELDED